MRKPERSYGNCSRLKREVCGASSGDSQQAIENWNSYREAKRGEAEDCRSRRAEGFKGRFLRILAEEKVAKEKDARSRKRKWSLRLNQASRRNLNLSQR